MPNLESPNTTHPETVEIFNLGMKLGMSLPYIPLMIIALFGNSLVCYVIHRYLQHSVTNIFLFNLSITDILSTLAVIPMTAIADIWLNHWPFGAAMCKLVRLNSGAFGQTAEDLPITNGLMTSIACMD